MSEEGWTFTIRSESGIEWRPDGTASAGERDAEGNVVREKELSVDEGGELGAAIFGPSIWAIANGDAPKGAA